MKKILLLLVLPLGINTALCQAFKKYAVGKSGCSAYFYCDPGEFEMATSTDSSVLYTGECVSAGITYDLICVQLKEKAPDLDLAAHVLEQYLDYLKSSYDIAGAKGYTKDLRLGKRETTRGIMDNWKDNDNNYIKVTGWTDGNFIAVLLAISPKELPEAKITAFLNGFAFPAAKTSAKKPVQPAKKASHVAPATKGVHL